MNQIIIRPSKYPTVMTTGRSKSEEFGQTAMKYAYEAAMNAFGVYSEEVTAASLDWGNLYEYNAIEAYQDKKLVEVVLDAEHLEVVHPEFAWAKGHVDGKVGNDGIIEVKCPYNPSNHVDNVLFASQYEKQYKAQIQGYLWITGRKWSDFISYDPRFPENLQLSVHRFERDDEFIDDVLVPRLIKFHEIVQDIVQKLSKIQ